VHDLLRCANHLFVAAMVAWVHPGLPPSANQKTEGQSAFGAVKFSGEAKATGRRSPGVAPPFIGNSTSESPFAPVQELLLCAKHLIRRCHGGWGSSRTCRETVNRNLTEGQSAFRSREVFRGKTERSSIFLIEERIYDNLQLHSLAKRTQFS
jgi:hypothetical protein